MSDFDQIRNEELVPFDDNLSVAHVVKYLSTLAKLHENLGAVSANFSTALKEIADRLRPYSQSPLSELPNVFDNNLQIGRKSSRIAKKTSFNLPENLKSLKLDDIESIINNPNLTKIQLVALGISRLGIAKSKLDRLSRVEIIESINAAINHERSLNIISDQAKRTGENRSS